MAWRRHDDLVVLEDGVEVRHDPDRPAGRVGLAATGTEGERLGGRAVLATLAERAREQLVLGWQVEVCTRACARPLRAPRSDDDPLTGDRILAELPRRVLVQLDPSVFFSRNGRIRSIGVGKTIVVDCEPLMSSSVWR